jgi:glycosyltransferase involved in cell wall biosynthesis
MKTYARELTRRLPIVAPEYAFVAVGEGANFGWSEQVALPRAVRAANVALTHYLAHYVPWTAPKPFVLTIHDLIHLRYPQFYKSKVGPYYRTVVKRACDRAARIITDDPRTIGDLERFLGVDPAKVRAVALGVDESFLGPIDPIRAPHPYLFYVGNHRTHKDLRTFFDAWSSLPPECAVDILVTGPDDFAGELQRRATRTRRIVALGEVDPSSLARYYAGALALVHPALCEGFGLSLLEAMASRCPVIASADSVPRVLAASSLVFPTGDAAALRVELERIVSDEGLRARLVNRGYETAKGLTWERCARATADCYREIVEETP